MCDFPCREICWSVRVCACVCLCVCVWKATQNLVRFFVQMLLFLTAKGISCRHASFFALNNQLWNSTSVVFVQWKNNLLNWSSFYFLSCELGLFASDTEEWGWMRRHANGHYTGYKSACNTTLPVAISILSTSSAFAPYSLFIYILWLCGLGFV